MMKYQFDTMCDRRNSSSLKWDVAQHELPMWVADMDFETAPEIVKALQQRVKHNIFGYNVVSPTFFDSIQAWWRNRYDMYYEKEWMLFCTGVVPAISSIIRRLTNIGDQVLIQAPVYNIFYNSILHNGRHVVSNDLQYDGKSYSIDYNDLELKLSNPLTTLMILCNPHNPIGKLWDQETLLKIGQLCSKHHVVVIADEIHCDIVAPGKSYIPFARVSKENANISITCVAPTKAFNLAGLQTSCLIIPNEQLRNSVRKGINTDEIAEPNSFGVNATIAAFHKGEPWLQEMCSYVEGNKRIAVAFIHEHLPFTHVIESEATYLLWIDCSRVCSNDVALLAYIKASTGLLLSEGSAYGANGTCFVRMNVACPKERLQDGLERFQQGILQYMKSENSTIEH